MFSAATHCVNNIKSAVTYCVHDIDASSTTASGWFHDPRSLSTIVCGTQLLVLGRHEERSRYEVEVLEAAEVLHLLDVLEEFVLAGELV